MVFSVLNLKFPNSLVLSDETEKIIHDQDIIKIGLVIVLH
jgi:hypothetical protein